MIIPSARIVIAPCRMPFGDTADCQSALLADVRVEGGGEDAIAGFELHPDAVIAGRGEFVGQINFRRWIAGVHVVHAVIHSWHAGHI